MSGPSSAEVEVVELFPGRRRDRKRFVELPFRLAAAHPSWQPGLRRLHEDVVHPARNPFWRSRAGSFFVALRGRRTVGRVAVVDPGSLPDRPEAAVLAFPDFVEDPAVAERLLAAAETRARERRARELVGPMNPDIHHDVGIQVSGHDRRNAVLMGFQPPYYSAYFEAQGFERLADFEAWALERETFTEDGRLLRAVRRVERQAAFRIRPVDLRRFDQELALFFRLYQEAFAGHWGFAPPSWDEFRFLAGDLRHILRPNMALVAEWEGEPAGFVLGVPDLYAIIPKATRGRMTPRFFVEMLLKWRRVDEARVMIAGVRPAFRRHGIHLPLFYRIARAIFDLGFRGGEISWVLAENRPLQKALPLLGARRTKTYRLYAKRLHQ
jgi:hypothetical protein